MYHGDDERDHKLWCSHIRISRVLPNGLVSYLTISIDKDITFYQWRIYVENFFSGWNIFCFCTENPDQEYGLEPYQPMAQWGLEVVEKFIRPEDDE